MLARLLAFDLRSEALAAEHAWLETHWLNDFRTIRLPSRNEDQPMQWNWILHTQGPDEPVYVIEADGTARFIARLDDEYKTRAELMEHGIHACRRT